MILIISIHLILYITLGAKMKSFINSYISKLTKLLTTVNIKKIEEIINTIDTTKGKIFVLGNGGSADTSSHMVNDLGAGLARRKIKYITIESLADNTSACTAIANDTGFENIFYYQLKNRLKPEDIIIAISCSGNSANILKAVEYAKQNNVKIISMTGFTGGKLQELSDINFHVETNNGEYGLVEDMHMILNHIIYSYFISLNKKTQTEE